MAYFGVFLFGFLEFFQKSIFLLLKSSIFQFLFLQCLSFLLLCFDFALELVFLHVFLLSSLVENLIMTVSGFVVAGIILEFQIIWSCLGFKVPVHVQLVLLLHESSPCLGSSSTHLEESGNLTFHLKYFDVCKFDSTFFLEIFVSEYVLIFFLSQTSLSALIIWIIPSSL